VTLFAACTASDRDHQLVHLKHALHKTSEFVLFHPATGTVAINGE
jgi:hypothetical protein